MLEYSDWLFKKPSLIYEQGRIDTSVLTGGAAPPVPDGWLSGRLPSGATTRLPRIPEPPADRARREEIAASTAGGLAREYAGVERSMIGHMPLAEEVIGENASLILEVLQLLTSIAGDFAPPIHITNAAVYSLREEWGMVLISLISAIPILGGPTGALANMRSSLLVWERLAGEALLARILRSSLLSTVEFLQWLARPYTIRWMGYGVQVRAAIRIILRYLGGGGAVLRRVFSFIHDWIEEGGRIAGRGAPIDDTSGTDREGLRPASSVRRMVTLSNLRSANIPAEYSQMINAILNDTRLIDLIRNHSEDILNSIPQLIDQLTKIDRFFAFYTEYEQARNTDIANAGSAATPGPSEPPRAAGAIGRASYGSALEEAYTDVRFKKIAGII